MVYMIFQLTELMFWQSKLEITFQSYLIFDYAAGTRSTATKLRTSNFFLEGGRVENVQNFLIKLGIKPLEISIFSLNNDLVRLTKIMNNLVKNLKILSFKVIFQGLKLVESFQKKISEKNI